MERDRAVKLSLVKASLYTNIYRLRSVCSEAWWNFRMHYFRIVDIEERWFLRVMLCDVVSLISGETHNQHTFMHS